MSIKQVHICDICGGEFDPNTESGLEYMFGDEHNVPAEYTVECGHAPTVKIRNTVEIHPSGYVYDVRISDKTAVKDMCTKCTKNIILKIADDIRKGLLK